ncbi:MAG TPA: hypothetical protein VNA13_03605 [Xanthomonadales bacterium]|nr:hypothetical protein [Xanthomonadales bacterium]
MNKLAFKFGAGLAAASLFAATAMPAFAATTVKIKGNGAFSTNKVKIIQTTTTTVTQSNSAAITNTVTTTQKTGSNSSSFNTGGSTLVVSGEAETTVHIVNVANANIISL